jgi:putative ATP-dependent endonuclease of the OLD family
MRLRKLEIQNFRSIGDLTLDLSPLCALIGCNNAGKSNILDAITLLIGERWPLTNISERDYKDHDATQRLLIRGWFDGEIDAGPLGRAHGFCIEGPLSRLEFYPFDDRGNRLMYRGGRAGNISNDMRDKIPAIYVGVDRTAQTQLRPTQYTMYGRILKALNEDFRQDGERVTRFKTKIGEALSELKTPLLEEVENTVKESLKRQTNLGDLGLRFSLHDPVDFYKTIRPFIKDHADAHEFDVEEMGSGVQSAIVIGLMEAFKAVVRESAVLLVEEPELFLHPHAARHFHKLLEEIAESGIQVILTTHSSSFVDLAHPEQVYIVRRVDGVSEASHTQALGQDEREQAKIITRFDGTANEAFFARVVVITEGPPDRMGVQHAFSLDDWDPDLHGVTITAAESKSSIPLLAKVLHAFDIPTLVLCDADPGKPTGEDLTHRIEEVVGADNVVLFDPDLDTVCGTRAKTGKDKLEPAAAQKFFAQHYRTLATMPESFKAMVQKAKAIP